MRRSGLNAILRRLYLAASELHWGVMLALLLGHMALGWALLFFWYGGFRGAGWHIHFMHLTGLAMAGVFVAKTGDGSVLLSAAGLLLAAAAVCGLERRIRG